MRAIVLVKNGEPDKAFELQEMADLPAPKPEEVKIAVEGFGLNFADVMARLGKYQDCPPLPCIIGYEAVGRVAELGKDIQHLKEGDRVLAFTRFNAYAEQLLADGRAVVKIPESLPLDEATALATQYVTAYFAAEYITRLHKGEQVLIQSAAGGVGTALVQLAKHRGAYIYGTAGSDEKVEHLAKQGVDVPINYKKYDFAKEIKSKSPGRKVDVVFDAVGGKSVKKAYKLLNSGGRLVCYGAASISGRGINIFKTLAGVAGFGLYHPVQFMMNSKSILGVNMLRIADNKPDVMQYCLEAVVRLYEEGIFKPIGGGIYPLEQLGEAHEHLEFRKSIGKLAVHW